VPSKDYRVETRVILPDGASLKIEMKNGDVSASGLSLKSLSFSSSGGSFRLAKSNVAAIAARLREGKVLIEESSGMAQVALDSGEASIDGFDGSVSFSSTSGSVSIEGGSGARSVATVSGGVTISLSAPAPVGAVFDIDRFPVIANTISGRIEVSAPNGVYRVSARSAKGSIRIFPAAPPGESKPATGVVEAGSGSGTISLSTESGAISVTFE